MAAENNENAYLLILPALGGFPQELVVVFDFLPVGVQPLLVIPSPSSSLSVFVALLILVDFEKRQRIREGIGEVRAFRRYQRAS